VAVTWYLPVSCPLTISSETPHSTRNIVSENLSNNPVDGWMLKFTLAFFEPGLSIAWLMIQRYGYLIRLFERTKNERKKNNNEKRDLWYFISNKLIIDTFYFAHFPLTRVYLSVVKLHNSFFNNIYFSNFFFFYIH